MGYICRGGGMVDAKDLKSFGIFPCRFESGPRQIRHFSKPIRKYCSRVCVCDIEIDDREEEMTNEPVFLIEWFHTKHPAKGNSLEPDFFVGKFKFKILIIMRMPFFVT